MLFGSSYWQGLVDWLRQQVLARGNIGADDVNLVRITDSAEEACRYLVDCYQNQSWLSPTNKGKCRANGRRSRQTTSSRRYISKAASHASPGVA